MVPFLVRKSVRRAAQVPDHEHDFVVKSQKQRGFTLVIKSKCRQCSKKIEEVLM